MKNPLRDEVYADCIGLIAAFGEYNPLWARTFLGIESDTYRKGGRLEHYDPDCSEEAVQQAGQWISEAEKGVLAIWDRQKWDSMSDQDRNQALFGLLAAIY